MLNTRFTFTWDELRKMINKTFTVGKYTKMKLRNSTLEN